MRGKVPWSIVAQAVSIGLAEARREGKKVPRKRA
jgi:hypothetical protein